MTKEIYTVVAGAMRYVFVLLGILIVLRAFLMLRRDRRETRRLLRRLPDAGSIGEFEVLRGGEGLEEGSVLPVPAEGTLGYYRSCDLTLPCKGVHKRHLDFILDDRAGLLILPRSGCSVTVDGAEINARSKPKLHPMLHGSVMVVGEAVLRLRLFAGVCPEYGAAFMPDRELPVQPPETDVPDPFRATVDAIPDLTAAIPVRSPNASPKRIRHTDREEGDWGE